jgi:hypothetical protein
MHNVRTRRGSYRTVATAIRYVVSGAAMAPQCDVAKERRRKVFCAGCSDETVVQTGMTPLGRHDQILTIPRHLAYYKDV